MALRRPSFIRPLALAALLTTLPLGVVAEAASALRVTTPYPAVVADPGGSVRFPLTVDATGSGTISLDVSGVPTGWTATIRGGGSIVSATYIDDGQPAEVELEVKVPADATPGRHRLSVLASEADGPSATLPVEVDVADAAAGGATLEAKYPTLKGAADATYRFDLTLRNDTSQQQTFALQASGPPGWTVDARPSSSTQAATAVVDAGGTTQVQVNAEPPADVTAGTYVIAVEALGGPTAARSELAVEIVGSYELAVSTPDGRLNADATAGSPSPLTLEVRNSGSAPLAGVTLSATPPKGWTVTFDPELIEAIAPGDAASVTAQITAADDAIAGDYVLTITAKAEQASAETDIRTTVQTSPLWGFVGLAAIALVLGGLYLVFQRFGRR